MIADFMQGPGLQARSNGGCYSLPAEDALEQGSTPLAARNEPAGAVGLECLQPALLRLPAARCPSRAAAQHPQPRQPVSLSRLCESAQAFCTARQQAAAGCRQPPGTHSQRMMRTCPLSTGWGVIATPCCCSPGSEAEPLAARSAAAAVAMPSAACWAARTCSVWLTEWSCRCKRGCRGPATAPAAALRGCTYNRHNMHQCCYCATSSIHQAICRRQHKAAHLQAATRVGAGCVQQLEAGMRA